MYSILKLLYFAALLAICQASVCLECEGIIPLQDTNMPTFFPTTLQTPRPTTTPTVVPTAPPTGSPTVTPTAPPTGSPTMTPTVAPTSCAPTGNNCGGTNDFGEDAAVEPCCVLAETCTRRNARRWRCQL